MSEYRLNIVSKDGCRFELVVYGETWLSTFQDKPLSKVIFSYLNRAGEVVQITLVDFQHESNEEAEPSYTKEIKTAKGTKGCVLRIFGGDKFYDELKLVHVFVETCDKSYLAVDR